jgi:hypothetical protein
LQGPDYVETTYTNDTSGSDEPDSENEAKHIAQTEKVNEQIIRSVLLTDSDREDQGEDDSENIIKHISAEVNGTDNIEINISQEDIDILGE